MRYLITPSLLNSWMWFLNAPESMCSGARTDLEATLKKEPISDNEYMRAGRNFEAAIYKSWSERTKFICEDKKYENCVNEVVGMLGKFGAWQVKLSKEVQVSGVNVLLYGRCDFMSGGAIIDIKFVNSYDTGKYVSSSQHPLYLRCADWAHEFNYLISDGENVYVEKYMVDQVPPIESIVSDFLSFCKSNTWAEDLFFDKWRSK